jgi:hypothetical protein
LGIVEVVHVRVEHQRSSTTTALERTDNVGPAVFDILILDLHAEFFEFAAEVLGNLLFPPGNADDIGQIASHINDAIPVHLIEHSF